MLAIEEMVFAQYEEMNKIEPRKTKISHLKK